MPLSVWVSTGIVIAACVAFVLIGNAYRWDLAASGYGRWTRAVGVIALLGLAASAAWELLDRPALAAVVMAGGALLSAGFVTVHRRLTARVQAALAATADRS